MEPFLRKQIRLLEVLANTMIDDHLRRHLHQNPRYQDPRKLNRYEAQVFSQSGEDGILGEIFRRIGTANRFFVEFGTESGLENNTTCLLNRGWSGAWIEGDPDAARAVRGTFRALLDKGVLAFRNAKVTAENIEGLFGELGVPETFDLMSVDIDGNDYWVWRAVRRYRPRVVVIEYNATFPPDMKWVMKYDPDYVWPETTYFGASLKSMECLGREKGYRLVGCSYTGVNAFFVHEDLVGEHFLEPFTAENHYEPPRYHLIRRTGHKRGFGDFEVR